MAIALLILCGSAAAQRDPMKKWLSKKPLISKIEVTGNEFFSDDRIKRSIRTKENGFWQSIRLSKKQRLRKDAKRIDLAALNYLYRSSGFVQARIDEEFAVADDSSAIIRIAIDEGTRLFVREAYSPTDLGSFTNSVYGHIIKLRRGDPLNPYKVMQLTFDIKTVFANSGYPYATVRDSVVAVDGVDSVDVLFVIERGPLTLFGDVHVDSLKFTRSDTFLREMVLRPGDLYSRQKIIDSRQRVYSTGLASFVDLTLLNPQSDDRAKEYDVRPDFRLKVIERNPKFAKIKTGAGQDKEQDLVWDLSFEFGNRNISGRGRQVRFEMFSSFLVFADEWRVLKERFAFEYMEPWLFKIRMPLNVRFAVEPGIRSKTQNYRISRINFGLSTARDLSLISRIWGGVQWEEINITGIPIEQLDQLKKEEGISVKRKLLFSYERDTRNNLLLPIRGSFIRFDTEYVGGFLGGDNKFVKASGSVSRYQNFYGSNIYAWNYRAGWVEGTARDPYVPTVDRFYLGGGKTIRGYSANDVGPRDDEGNLAGGRVFVQSNHEIRRPLFWKLWGSAFVDIGNNYEDVQYIKFDNLLVSTGAGLQYISPVGPVRLDYGQRVIYPGYDPGGRFHFSILYAF